MELICAEYASASCARLFLAASCFALYILSQSTDYTHKPNIDRENQQGGSGNKNGGGKERLKEASDLGHEGAFRVNAFSWVEF